MKLPVVNGTGKETMMAVVKPADFFGEGCLRLNSSASDQPAHFNYKDFEVRAMLTSHRKPPTRYTIKTISRTVPTIPIPPFLPHRE